MSKKVLITGATGLIGKECLQPLLDKGYEVFAISRKQIKNDNICFLQGTIFDNEFVEKVFKKVKPKYLLNFAWITEGDYLSSEDNYLFENAGIALLKEFVKNGGKNAVFAGTCFEYKQENKILTEFSPIESKTVYAKCKNSLREKGELFSKEQGINFAWGRIFYVLGHNEHKTRLMPKLIESLNSNKDFYIKTPNDVKDYMYSKDIARAFVEILDKNINGTVNICSGQGFSILELAKKTAKLLNKEHLIKIAVEADLHPHLIIGDNSKLKNEIGFNYKYSIDQAIDNILKFKN